MLVFAITAGILVVGGAVFSPPLAGAGLLLLTLPLLTEPTVLGFVNRYFLRVLVVVLFGYALGGRGFAYLGVSPIYIGEIVFGFGILAALFSGQLRNVLTVPVTWWLMAFVFWGATRTLPYLGNHGVNALRDGAIWGYAGFGVIVSATLLRTGWLERVPHAYKKLTNWLVIWTPIGVTLTVIGEGFLPRVPGSDVPVIYVKPGDMAVHLGGAAAFMILGIARTKRNSERGSQIVLEWIWWSAWLLGAVVTASHNRGGLISLGAAFLLAMWFKPLGRWWRVAFLAVAGAALAFMLQFEVTIRQGGDRTVSVQQLAENVTSIFSESRPELGGTKEWRLAWWADIVDYTVFGEHFWTGKGYGVNLADDDGYQVRADGSLRSPHNGHLTILARSGVPGMILWVLLQVSFAWLLCRSFWHARRRGDTEGGSLRIWVLCYWLAFMLNGTFDVFLEGPQGGIWFWCLIGFGTAVLISDKGTHLPTPSLSVAPGPF